MNSWEHFLSVAKKIKKKKLKWNNLTLVVFLLKFLFFTTEEGRNIYDIRTDSKKMLHIEKNVYKNWERFDSFLRIGIGWIELVLLLHIS